MDKFNFDQIIKKLEQAKSSLPKVLANDTKKFFLSSWQKQGWDDGVVKSWAPRKYNKNKRAAGRSILVKSGALRRAVNTSLKSETFDNIKFSVDLPYAQIHNDGLTMKNGKRMPQRKYMGDSASLRKIQKQKIQYSIDKIFK